MYGDIWWELDIFIIANFCEIENLLDSETE